MIDLCESPENNIKIIIQTRSDIRWEDNSSTEPRRIIMVRGSVKA